MSENTVKTAESFSEMRKDFQETIKKATIPDPKTPNTAENPTEYLYDKLQILEGTLFNKVNPLDAWRQYELSRLQRALEEARSELISASEQIYGRTAENTLLHELDSILEEINYSIKNHKYWIRENLDSSYLLRSAKSYQLHEPYGLVLIIGDWQAPLLSTIRPLIAALSAGNHAVVYGDPRTKKISEILGTAFKKHLDEKKAVFLDPNTSLETVLKEKFDFIYATGDEAVCRLVARRAGETFTPYTCNKRGLNIAIVDETTDLNTAVEKLIYAKFLNNGQFPTVPDQIYVHEKVFNDFIVKSKIFLYVFYGQSISTNKEYGRIISTERAEELLKAIQAKNGGNFETKLISQADKRVIEPVIISNPDETAEIANRELRGPVLVLKKFSEINEIQDTLTGKNVENVYYFTKNTKRRLTLIEKLKNSHIYINNASIQHLDPFNPLVSSGPFSNNQLGGRFGFRTFSRSRVVVEGGNLLFFKSLLPPFTSDKFNSLKKYNLLRRTTNRTVRNITLGAGLVLAYQWLK